MKTIEIDIFNCQTLIALSEILLKAQILRAVCITARLVNAQFHSHLAITFQASQNIAMLFDSYEKHMLAQNLIYMKRTGCNKVPERWPNRISVWPFSEVLLEIHNLIFYNATT